MPPINVEVLLPVHNEGESIEATILRLRFQFTSGTRLAGAGWHLTPIGKSGADVLYRVNRP
jgi:hypothetical protein